MVAMKRIILACAILLFLFGRPDSSAALPSTPGPVRGLWVIRHNLASPQSIDSVFHLAVQAEITDLFVQVRGRGDVYYRSKLEPQAKILRHSNFDPLAYLLRLGKKYGIRIHAWMNIFYIWSADSLPEDRNHLVWWKTDWLARPLNRSDVLSNYPASVKDSRAEGLYLSPLLPEAQNYLLKLFRELLQNYPVDGIHLDYIRFPNRFFDFHPRVVQQFKHRYVLDPIQLMNDPDSFARKYTLAGYETYYFHWGEFLRDGLSKFVQLLSQRIRQQAPGIIVSAAVKPDIRTARWDYYQDWVRWIREGWLDWVIPMNYTPQEKRFRERISSYLDQVPPEKFLVGIALYNQPEENAIRKIFQVNVSGNAGFVLFSYDQLRKQKRLLKVLKEVAQNK